MRAQRQRAPPVSDALSAAATGPDAPPSEGVDEVSPLGDLEPGSVRCAVQTMKAQAEMKPTRPTASICKVLKARGAEARSALCSAMFGACTPSSEEDEPPPMSVTAKAWVNTKTRMVRTTCVKPQRTKSTRGLGKIRSAISRPRGRSPSPQKRSSAPTSAPSPSARLSSVTSFKASGDACGEARAGDHPLSRRGRVRVEPLGDRAGQVGLSTC